MSVKRAISTKTQLTKCDFLLSASVSNPMKHSQHMFNSRDFELLVGSVLVDYNVCL